MMARRKEDQRKHYTMLFYKEMPGPESVADNYVEDHRNWIIRGATSDAIDMASKMDPIVWGAPKPLEPRQYIYAFIRIRERETGRELSLALRNGSWAKVADSAD